MSLRKVVPKLTVEEYLEAEKDGTIRHEYVDGEVYAMSGASKRHNLVANNLNVTLRQCLRGGPCQVFFVDVKVRVEAANVFYYPDLVVACDPTDDHEYYVTQPILVVEVESPSTSAIDRREKLMTYRKLDSLREYLLLAQDTISATVFRREQDGLWSSEELGAGQELHLESVDLTINLSALYEGVRLPAE